MAIIKNLIGLDIGSDSIKLVKLKKIKGKIELEKARVIELKDFGSIKQGVASLLKSEKISSCKAAISISGQSVFTRFVKLPKISQKKVEQIVKYEAQQQIPFPIEKVVWDYQLFENSKISEIEVCLAAVKKEIVDRLYNELSQLKINIISIQPSPIALYNILKFNQDIKDNTVVLDIGAKVTDVFITKGRRIWIRSIPIAGKEITCAISARLDISLEEAELLKQKEAITLIDTTGDEDLTPRSDVISKAINPVLIDLLKEISRSISYYKSQFNREGICKNVLLTGGSSNIKYIEKFFENNLKIKTQKPDLLKRITPNKFTRAVLDETEGQWAVALGLGLMAVTEPTININLLSKEQKKLKKFDSKKTYIFTSEGIAILIFLILSIFCINNIKVNKKDLSLINDKMGYYRKNIEIINHIQSDIDNLEKKLNFLVKIEKNRLFWLDILAEINSRISKDIWLISFAPENENKKAVIIEGKTTGSFDSVKNLGESLKKSEYFVNVETLKANPATKRKNKTAKADYNIIFAMRLELKNK